MSPKQTVMISIWMAFIFYAYMSMFSLSMFVRLYHSMSVRQFSIGERDYAFTASSFRLNAIIVVCHLHTNGKKVHADG